MSKVGQLLNDKNALLNYIYDRDGFKIGVVVGMKGTDRENPLVGWSLFHNFDEKETVNGTLFDAMKCNPELRKLKEYFTNLDRMISELDTSSEKKKYVEGVIALNTIKSAPIKYNVQPAESVLHEDDLYHYVERAILRANSDSKNFFVCKNPTYNQERSDLTKSINNKDRLYKVSTEWYGGVLLDESVTACIRRTIRSMEFRCWRYFK